MPGPSGVAIEGNFVANAHKPNKQEDVAIAALGTAGAKALVVWASRDEDRSSWGIFSRVIDAP